MTTQRFLKFQTNENLRSKSKKWTEIFVMYYSPRQIIIHKVYVASKTLIRKFTLKRTKYLNRYFTYEI